MESDFHKTIVIYYESLFEIFVRGGTDMNCPRCGTKMQGGVCPECGFPVNQKKQNIGKSLIERYIKKSDRLHRFAD